MPIAFRGGHRTAFFHEEFDTEKPQPVYQYSNTQLAKLSADVSDELTAARPYSQFVQKMLHISHKKDATGRAF